VLKNQDTKVNLDKSIDPVHAQDVHYRFSQAGDFVRSVGGEPIKKAGKYWHMLGPGLTTGAADDDPSGMATYSQAGSQYGFQFLWLAPLTFPLMAVVQEMCARIGLVTGRGLAGNIKLHYSRPVLYFATILLFAANAFNIGANLGAMAGSVQLFLPNVNVALVLILFAGLSLFLQIFTSYANYAKYLKWMALVLISYVLTAFAVDLPWSDVLKHTVVPSFSFSKDHIIIICAILGTTISPYLFFWQTSQEVEGQILSGKTSIQSRVKEVSNKEIKNMRIDVWSGMFLSNVVMFFIIATCAATLFANGITIETAQDAARALEPLAGRGATLLFAIGIIGTGLLSVPVLAGSASYAITESFGWREGLYRKFKQAHAFYGVIIISMIVGLLFNFVGIHPIDALIYSAVANGIVAPVVLIFIVQMSSSKKIMGDRVNKPLVKVFGWLVTLLMLMASIATLIFLIF
jgi:NRAMP (natural resistance-associated macrophage protein)-like metal ion transporter